MCTEGLDFVDDATRRVLDENIEELCQRVDPRNPLGSGPGSELVVDGRRKARVSVSERRRIRRFHRQLMHAESKDEEQCALRGYEKFHQLPSGSATIEQVDNSSAGRAGWVGYSCTLEPEDGRVEVDRLAKQRELLDRLGVLDEVAARRRVRFADEGTRGATMTTGYISDLQLNLFEVSDPQGSDSQVLANEQEWQDIEFEVALDSGSQDHVCDEEDCPGYLTEVSPGSSRGQCFVVGNGGRLENMGQRSLNLEPMNDSSTPLSSCFQIARVTRPLMSVDKICDNGLKVEFDDEKAVVRDKLGAQVCVFERKPGGGLYVCKFRLKGPSPGFARQG